MPSKEMVVCYSCGEPTPLWKPNGDDAQCYDEWDNLVWECPDCHQAHGMYL